ncbi:MAG: hypothetical protein SGJ23_08060 [Alphaproteobacteria bacterium]|nr:hypothetical protein [Alphaproteobacteria bacterium]
MLRTTLIVGAAFMALAACEPKPPEAPPAAEAAVATVAEADTETRNALLTALTGVIEYELGGQRVSFKLETARTQGDFGWVQATPLTREGAPIDWSKTKYDEQNREGMLDGGGATRALLQKVNGVWEVKAFDIGSTDVAWGNWPTEYRAPPELMGLSGATEEAPTEKDG